MAAVIMLSGPVGAGKTTVARELVTQLPGPTSYIEGDRFWAFVAKAERQNRRKHFSLVMRSMTAASVPFARSGFDVVLDFSIPPEFLETARKILKEVPLDYVVLRPSEAVCASRAAGRAEGRIADYGPYRDFYSLFGGAVQYTISDDGADAKTLATRVRAGLSAGKYRVS